MMGRFLQNLCRIFLVLLLATIGAGSTGAAPANWSQTELSILQQSIFAGTTDPTNAAPTDLTRALALSGKNVGATGGLITDSGIFRALDGTKVLSASLNFSRSSNAPNTAGEVITGARTLSRMDAEGWDLAEDFYEQMRRSGGSVDEIAENTGLSRGAVERAYRHLFLDSHQLDDGLRRFDADPEIVNAWNRMRNGTHTTADIDLVNHERFEAILMQRYGQPYRCAHAAANACGFQSPIDD